MSQDGERRWEEKGGLVNKGGKGGRGQKRANQISGSNKQKIGGGVSETSNVTRACTKKKSSIRILNKLLRIRVPEVLKPNFTTMKK